MLINSSLIALLVIMNMIVLAILAVQNREERAPSLIDFIFYSERIPSGSHRKPPNS